MPYKASIRVLEEALVRLKQGTEPAKEDLAAIRTTLDGLEESAPVVMPKIYDAIERKYQDLKYTSTALGLYSKALRQRGD